ncbi:MAG: MATE family efflux transporter [Erysipelotrichaceae bacterium]|nr:MATE family efflux transporter [Erysipelotrichaceae bacterium]
MKNLDFSKGKISNLILAQALPLTVAQLVHLLYNIVDRIYLGHLPGHGSMALTGVGITFPIITLIAAFTNLYGTGGTPLFSIARGAKDEERAEKLMGTTACLLAVTSIVLMAVCYVFRKPILYAFGASDASYAYADQYLQIYLLGTLFSMIATGMNGFINAQGFPRMGMLTVMIGAVLNLILDPLFIFGFNMGVRGAAAATVISQVVSAVWVIRFLLKDTIPVRLKQHNFRIVPSMASEIIKVGTAGFVMQGTNCLVQVLCNRTLSIYGGDLYVGVMTVLNSVREILSLPVSGMTGGAQPVIGYNYGAKEYGRVKSAIRFMTLIGSAYTVCAWLIVFLFPGFFIRLFSSDAAMITPGISAMHIYFFGFPLMSFQMSGQTTFQSLGKSKYAIFFSLLRKAFIVAPLTVLLPKLMGVNGVFAAEPISNALGGLACFITMYFVVYRKLGKEPV